MIAPIAIDHTTLFVRSLPEAKEYYEQLFGLASIPIEGEGNERMLAIESKAVHFFLCESKSADQLISNQHLSFEVNSLSEVIETLKNRGLSDFKTGEVTFFSHSNYKWCEWRDPSGIRLECIEKV